MDKSPEVYGDYALAIFRRELVKDSVLAKLVCHIDTELIDKDALCGGAELLIRAHQAGWDNALARGLLLVCAVLVVLPGKDKQPHPEIVSATLAVLEMRGCRLAPVVRIKSSEHREAD